MRNPFRSRTTTQPASTTYRVGDVLYDRRSADLLGAFDAPSRWQQWAGAMRRMMAPGVAAEEQRAITSMPWVPFNQGNILGSGTGAEQALSLTPVFAAVQMIAGDIATLPVKTYRRSGEQRIPMASLPQLFAQLDDAGLLVDWLHRCMTSLLLWGNAYGLITSRDGLQFPSAVMWLDPAQVACDERNPTAPVWYYAGRHVPTENLLHIPWFTVAGKVQGLSPIAAFATTLNIGLQAQDYTLGWFRAGGIPPGTFKNSAKTLNPDEAEIIKQRLVAAIANRKPIVYGADWEYTPITIPPEQAQFVQTMRLTATQIASIYRMPPEMIGGEAGGSLTYNCVDGETEILTLRGWLGYGELTTADTCLTLNVETGMAEWQPVDEVRVFDGPVEVIRLENQTHSSVTTANHRWPVMFGNRPGSFEGWRWATTGTLPSDSRICAAAPLVDVVAPKWSDAVVELVAWFWTEGWVGKYGSVVLTQSQKVNPSNVARIRAALQEVFGPPVELQTRSRPGWRESHEARGIARFHLNAKAGRLLNELAPQKVVSTEFLASLTRAQLELFVQCSIDADGYWRPDGGGFVISQRDRARLDAFQIAYALLGKSGVVRWQESLGMWVMCSASTVWRKPVGHKEYVSRETTGIVWCPKTRNRTWFARRQGTTYFTGNTVEQNTTYYVSHTLRPWLVKLESKFSAVLPLRQYVKFTADALVRADQTTRYSSYKIASDIGLLTLDEMRALEDRPPLPAGEETLPPELQPTNGAAPAIRRYPAVVDVDWWDETPQQSVIRRRYDRAELAAPELIRKFDPGQLRDPHTGKWIDTGQDLAHALESLSFDEITKLYGEQYDERMIDRDNGLALDLFDRGELVLMTYVGDPTADDTPIRILHDDFDAGTARQMADQLDWAVESGQRPRGRRAPSTNGLVDWDYAGDQDAILVGYDASGDIRVGLPLRSDDDRLVALDLSADDAQTLSEALRDFADALDNEDYLPDEQRSRALTPRVAPERRPGKRKPPRLVPKSDYPPRRRTGTARAARAHTPAGTESAHRLKEYWTKGEGLAKWADKPHPWTALYHHLLKYMDPEEAKRTASQWFHSVFGFWPGSDLNRVTHGHPPRGSKVGPG